MSRRALRSLVPAAGLSMSLLAPATAHADGATTAPGSAAAAPAPSSSAAAPAPSSSAAAPAPDPSAPSPTAESAAAPTAIDATDTTEPPPSPDETPALVFGFIAFGTLAAGAVLGVLAWQDHVSFLADPTTDTANRGQLRAFAADMCFAGGGSLALVSAAMFLRPDPSTGLPPVPQSKPRTMISLSPMVSRDGGGAAAVFTW